MKRCFLTKLVDWLHLPLHSYNFIVFSLYDKSQAIWSSDGEVATLPPLNRKFGCLRPSIIRARCLRVTRVDLHRPKMLIIQFHTLGLWKNAVLTNFIHFCKMSLIEFQRCFYSCFGIEIGISS